jgi:hypothetical protein
MKTILLILSIVAFSLPVLSFAGEVPDVVSLSNNVSATYFVDATSDATEYSISTGHSQGNRAFFSGNSDSRIYYTDLTDTFASSTDLLTSHVSSFESNSGDYTGAL